MRGVKVSHMMRAPVAAWMRPASSSPSSSSTRPRSRIADFLPFLSAAATLSISPASTVCGASKSTGFAAASASSQAVSAGRIKVAMPPGALIDAA